MNEHFCDLPNPLKAHIKIDGAYEHAEITKLYFKEPTARHCYISLKQIRGYFIKSMTQMQREIPNQSFDGKTPVAKQDGGEAEIGAEAFLLFVSMDADICAKFYNTIQEMLCNGLVFLDAEKKQPLKSSHLDTLDAEGLDKLIETYLDFFSTYFIPKI
jgi:hypothetical protein